MGRVEEPPRSAGLARALLFATSLVQAAFGAAYALVQPRGFASSFGPASRAKTRGSWSRRTQRGRNPTRLAKRGSDTGVGDGALNLNFLFLSVNANDPARRLQAVYNLLTNRLSLLADDGVTLLGNFAPGSSNVISNSHGSLNCAGTGISISGNRLTVLWSVSATPALTGANTISLRARDRGGLDTGFQLIPGVVWTIT